MSRRDKWRKRTDREATSGIAIRFAAGRARLAELAAQPGAYTSEVQRELERLKADYLPMWSEWVDLCRFERGFPGAVPFVNLMKPLVPDNYDADARPDSWVCNLIDESVNEVSENHSLRLCRAALAVRYMNARGPAAYHNGRLIELSINEIEDLCDAAERQLVHSVKRRGLPL